MKKNYLFTFLLTLMITSFSFGQDLVITGVFDGSLSGGTPKGIELYVLKDISDLSIYGVGSANNGGGSDGIEYTFPAEQATAGTFIYLTANVSEFKSFFGIDANYDGGSAVNINGDDAVELFMNDTVIDTYGVINVNGDDEPWDYTDGWAYRKNGTEPDGTTFNVSNWEYSGINGLEGGSNNATATTPFPLGTYTTTASTAPELSITTPTDNQVFDASVTEVTPIISIANFTLSADNGSGMGDNSGDGYIKLFYQETGKPDVNESLFSTTFEKIDLVPGSSYTLSLELVDNGGNSLDPVVSETVTFSVEFPCDIQLSTIETTCEAETSETDIYTTTIDFTGGNTGITYTITAKDASDNDVGTISGDNPNSVESGKITITGVSEGTDFTVKVIGGVGSSCDLTRNINSPTCFPAPTCPASGSIIITEIMQNPSSVSDDAGEYFEVYNTTNAAIDLQGWTIKTASTGNPLTHIITSSLVIQPNDYLVLGENADTVSNGGINIDYQYDSSLFLGNSTATITIECSPTVFDAVSYDNGATFPDPNGKSMELAESKFNATDNDNGANWGESTNELASGDFGTPGTSNSFTLSIIDNTIEGFATYPNPVTNNQFTITSNSLDTKKVAIFNVIGKKVFTTSVAGTKSTIDVSSISSGLYILKVTEGNKIATSKLVIK